MTVDVQGEHSSVQLYNHPFWKEPQAFGVRFSGFQSKLTQSTYNNDIKHVYIFSCEKVCYTALSTVLIEINQLPCPI